MHELVPVRNQLAAALALHPRNELRGIFWHQGESDVRHLGSDQYAAKLDALIAGFRAEFGPAPFILGQMNPDLMADAGEILPGRGLSTLYTATPHHASRCPASGKGQRGYSIRLKINFMTARMAV